MKLAARIAANNEHDIHTHNFPMHCQIVLKFFSHTFHECSFASFKLLTHTIPNHMTVTVQKWPIFTINPPLKSSEHDIHTHNFPMHCQIVLKFFPHTFHECSFASFKLLAHTKQFEIISSSEESKIPKISLYNEVIELEKANCSKSIREFESSSLDLPTSANSDSMNLDSLDDVEEIKRGEFELSRQEWDLIFPKCSKNTLKPGWTNIFNEKISSYYPICVIKFLYNRINKRYMIRNCPFFVAAATCKFSKCFSFKFVMETPETLENKGSRIKYVVTGSISMEHFSNRCSYSRHLVGDNREVVAKQLENSSPSNYHYSLFTDSEKISVAKHGNFNYLHSIDLLRKVKSQHLAMSRLDNDPLLPKCHMQVLS